jgi:hypothetical protein
VTSPATPTPPQYTSGWVKQDIGVTLAVAVRTDIVTANNFKDWGVMTLDHGGRYATWDEVSAWPDLAGPASAVASFSGDGDMVATDTGGPTISPPFSGDGALSATTG